MPHRFNIQGRILDLSSPRVMGILNVTPDSFSDGGQFNDPDLALRRIETMIEEGAAIIDVGGESTRPGSDPVDLERELRRVMPVFEKAVPEFPETIFSVDTTKYKVAKEALECGVHIINDISGLRKEPRMAELTAEFDAAFILMHSRGDPKTMQQDPEYDDIIEDISRFLKMQAARAEEAGVKNIIIDPGIGFGKTLEHNLKIVEGLDKFLKLGYPLMIGASRKSMIGTLLGGREVDGRLAGTLAVHYHALVKGARIIRVHDVKEAFDSVLVYNALTGC